MVDKHHFSTFNYLKNQLLTLNIYSLTIPELCNEIIKVLHHEFDEFKELSSLKIAKLTHKSRQENIPFVGTVSDFLKEEEEIVCEVRSLDIWLNLQIDFKTTNQYAQSFVKIKIENNCSLKLFKGICQKLALVVWNKYWHEKNLASYEISPTSGNESSKSSTKRRNSHLYDVRLLTPTQNERWVIKKTRSRRLTQNNQILRCATDRKTQYNSGHKVKLGDQELKGIIEEDDEHHGDFGYASKFATSNCKYFNLIIIVGDPSSIEHIYTITDFDAFKVTKDIYDFHRGAKNRNRNNKFKYSEEVMLNDDMNIWEMFHNNDNVKVKIDFKSLKEEIIRQKTKMRLPGVSLLHSTII